MGNEREENCAPGKYKAGNFILSCQKSQSEKFPLSLLSLQYKLFWSPFRLCIESLAPGWVSHIVMREDLFGFCRQRVVHHDLSDCYSLGTDDASLFLLHSCPACIRKNTAVSWKRQVLSAECECAVDDGLSCRATSPWISVAREVSVCCFVIVKFRICLCNFEQSPIVLTTNLLHKTVTNKNCVYLGVL